MPKLDKEALEQIKKQISVYVYEIALNAAREKLVDYDINRLTHESLLGLDCKDALIKSLDLKNECIEYRKKLEKEAEEIEKEDNK